MDQIQIHTFSLRSTAPSPPKNQTDATMDRDNRVTSPAIGTERRRRDHYRNRDAPMLGLAAGPTKSTSRLPSLMRTWQHSLEHRLTSQQRRELAGDGAMAEVKGGKPHCLAKLKIEHTKLKPRLV